MAADPSNNILITFEADASGLAPGVEGLEQMGKLDKQAADSFNKTNEALKQRQGLVEKNDSALQSYVQDLLKVQKATAGAFGMKGLQDFEKQVKSSADAMKILQASVNLAKQNLDKFKPNTPEWQKLNATIQQGEAFLKMYSETEDKAAQSEASFRTQIRQSTEALAQKLATGEATVAEIYNEAKAAGALKDAYGDATQAISVLSSDTFTFDAITSGVQVATGALQAFAGVSALVGEENEDLQKVLVKLNAVMAISAGIQQVINNLQKNNVLLLRLQTAGNEILAASNKATAATYAFLGVTVTETSVAFKALRAAIITTGIGVLLVGLGLAISALSNLTSKTEDAAEAQKKLHDAMLSAGEAGRDAGLKFLDQQEELDIARAKAAGKSEGEIFKIQENYQKLRIDSRKRFIRDNQLTAQEALKAEDELTDAEIKLQFDQLNQEAEINKNRADAQKEANNKFKQLAEADAQAIFNIRQRALQATIDFNNKIANDPSFGSQIQLDALQKSLKAQQDLISLQQNFELSKAGLTAKQKEDIIDKYNHEAAKLTQDGYDQQKQIISTAQANQVAADQAYYNKLIEEHNKFIQKLNSEVDERFKQINQNNSNEEIDQLGRLKNAYESNTITLQEFLQRREAILKEYSSRDLNNEIAALQAKISNAQASGLSTVELQEQLNAKLKEKYDKDAENYQNNQDKKDKAAEESAKKRQAIEQAAIQFASQILSSYFQAQHANYQRQEQEVQDLADKKLITEKEAQKRTNELRKQEAALNKQEALFNIAINTAVAASKAASQTGVGASIAIPIVEALGLALAAIVTSKQTPQYKEGGYTGDGPVDREAGVVHGKEFVMHAEATEKYRPLLEQMNALSFPIFDFPQMTDIPDWAVNQTFSSNIDYDKLGEAIAKHVGKIEDIPQYGSSWDENGVKEWIRKDNQLTIYLNKKSRFNK